MQILVIADYLPYPLISGDRIRIYNLIRRVASRHEVSLIAFLETPEDAEGVQHLKQFCANVETVCFQRRSRLAKIPGLLLYTLMGIPPELSLLYSKELVRKIRQLTSTEKFDIVQIEHSRMGMYLEALPQNKKCKSILMFHNFTFQQYRRISNVEQNWSQKVRPWINSLTMLQWEPRYAQRFNRSATVSEADRNLLLKVNPRLQVEVIPNGVDIQKYQLLPVENTTPSLLFIGNMKYPPCVDAVLYFCQEIFPQILRSIKTAEFWIVGRDPRPEVLQLNGTNIHVTGRVEDIVPYYRQCAVSVVPLRAGGGTRLKILEAMAVGRPVVSTTIGCEGLEVIDGQHILIADDPKQFADKVVNLLTDPQLHQRLSANARHLVETHYDWDRISDRLMDVYSEMQI